MSTPTSAVDLPISSPARGAAQYPPSRDFDLASKLDAFIQASEFSKAVDFLIFSIGQVDFSREKEAIFAYLFILLPHHDEKQYTQLCERLPPLLEVARDDPCKQSRLAQHLAERFIALTKELPLEQRIEYFISAQHFIAKAMKMETDPSAIKKCHQTASKHFVTLIFELLVKSKAFYLMIDEARRKIQVDRVRAFVRQLEDLQRLCCDEEDHKMIKLFQEQAIEVANVRNDESQACFAPIFAMVGQPFALPACFSTERYQDALQTFRLQFVTLDPVMDIRTAQKHYFAAFRTFFKVLIDDILAIMGPPPCGFDLRAMGSIGREEICTFSDLECLILIARDSPKIREYFSLFVKILELQIASFGETPDAIPFSFTCLSPPEMKGLYLDKPTEKDPVLIVTPTAMADMLKDRSLEGPRSVPNMVLRSSSLYTIDPTLHETYREESQRVIEALAEDPLKQRALRHIEIRHVDYQQIWKFPFSSTAESIQLKTQFIEPLFHLLGDLALFYHIQATNTLDIIDALKGRFNADSLTLLKEAVSFLYRLRIQVQNFYSEQKEEIYFPPHQTLQRHFVANQSIIHSLEKFFYLVIFPLYHVPKLSSIQSLDLANVAMTQALFDPFYTQNPKLLIPLIRQVALFLESTHAPIERHERYYRHIGGIPEGVFLWQTYIDNLQDPTIRAVLAKQSNAAGFRQEKRLREEALFAGIHAITTSHPVEGMQVQVTAPCFEGSRYLLPAVLEQILDGQGRITPRYASKHRVTSLVWQEHKLHFKMWPSHPLMEYALFDLYYRIAGQLSPANILARFSLTQDGKTLHYPVLISETIDHPTISAKTVAGDSFSNIDVKQWTWLILCSILTRTGDGRLSNYVISHLGKIFAIDNDIAFVFPTQESLFFSKINFACVLFFLSKDPPPLDPEVLQEFLSLDFDLILTSWLEETIAKEEEYNTLFNEEAKPVVLEVPVTDLNTQEKDSFTSSILFPPGAIIACRFQAAKMKSAIRKAQESNSPIFCFDLLKEFISLRTDLPLQNKVGERVFRAYTAAQKHPTVATRYAAAIGEKAHSSCSLADFQSAAFERPPTQEEIEEAAFSPQEALKELLTVIGRDEGQDRYATSVADSFVLQGHFAHLGSAEGPNLLRQELVLKYVTQLATSSAVKPTCVILRDCDVLNHTNLLPFLHPNVKIIDLRNSPQIFSRCLVLIAFQCPQLEELYLCRANIGAFPPSMTLVLVKFLKLRRLEITESPKLTSLQIIVPQLEYLNLSSNPNLETLQFIAHSFPKIVFKNSPIVLPLLSVENLSKMLVSERGLSNAVEFYREIFRNLIRDISIDDDLAYFEAIEERGLSLLESSEKFTERARQRLVDAARTLRTRLLERLEVFLLSSGPPLAREWLNICAYLHPDSIPIYFLDEWLKSECTEEHVPSKRDGVLASLSTDQTLLRYDSSTKTYSIPRRFQEIIKEKTENSSYVKACQLLIRLWNQIDFDNVRDKKEDTSKAVELLIHSDWLIVDPRFLALSSEDQTKFYSKMGRTRYEHGQYQEALELHQKALEIQQKSLDPNHLDIAASLHAIGCCLYSQGEYQVALEKHERALEIRRKSLDPNHLDISASLHEIGCCLYYQGKYQEALEKHESALEIRRKPLDSNHLDIASSLYEIGRCLYYQGKYQEALEKHESVLEIRRKSLNPNHLDIASSLHEVGLCLYFQRKYQEALEKHEIALGIRRKFLVPTHPDIVASLFEIGVCLHAQGKHQEALEKHRTVLEIRQKTLGPSHFYISHSLIYVGSCLFSLEKHERDLGIWQSLHHNHPDIAQSLRVILDSFYVPRSFYQRQRKYQEALDIHRRALEIRRKSLNRNHPDIATSLDHIGLCLFSQDSQHEVQEALRSFQEALEIRREVLDPNHLDIATSLYHIGNYFYSQGEYQEALEKHARVLWIRRKSLDPNHLDIADSYTYIGLCLYYQGKYQEALEKHQRALEIQRKSLDPNHPDIAKSLNNIGWCLYFQEKYQEALEKHEEALGIRQKSLDPNHLDIAESLYEIGCCLYSQGGYQEALEKHERALGIRRKSLDPNHLDIAASLHEIGLCFRFQSKTLEALAHFGEALEIRRKTLDSDHPDVIASLQNVDECSAINSNT